MSTIRLLALDDAPALAELLRSDWDFLAPWMPLPSEGQFTADGQRALIRTVLDRCQQGLSLPYAILNESGRLAGRITLSGIVRGPFQSGALGYWVGSPDNGRGLATAAAREFTGIVFGELGLHRIQAETLPHNVASQRVLERNGFTRIGMAPGYLQIAGKWQDHVLYQKLADVSDDPPAARLRPTGVSWPLAPT